METNGGKQNHTMDGSWNQIEDHKTDWYFIESMGKSQN